MKDQAESAFRPAVEATLGIQNESWHLILEPRKKA